jgi:oxygen-dependent protoporphyrinogen oxidase
MNPPRVAVVGAGITGLALAHRLSSRARAEGRALTLAVFDAGTIPGGHARTTREHGYLVEAGPNGFLDRSPGPLEMAKELGLESELIEASVAAKRRYIVRGGRLRRVPDSPATFLTSDALSPRGKARLLFEPWASGPPAHEETVHEFSTRRIGPEAADMLVDAAVSGISAGDSRVLSLPAAFPLMAQMEQDHGSLIKAMFARRKLGQGPPRLLTLRGGMGDLAHAAARALGPSLHLDTPVSGLARDGEGWHLTLGGGTGWAADEVLLALPATGAARVTSGLDHALSAGLAATPFSNVAVVALAFRAADLPRPLDGYGYLVTRGEGLATLGVVWESTLFEGRAPEGHVLVRAILGGPRRPDVAERSPEEATQLARSEFAQIMGVHAEPVHAWTFRWPMAIAQYTRGHAARRDEARAALKAYPGLALVGTSYDGVSLGSAIDAGRAEADRVIERMTAHT